MSTAAAKIQVESLLVHVAQLAIHLEGRVRGLENIVIDTYRLALDHPTIQNGMDAKRQYNEAPKTPHMGGPHHWAAAAVLRWIATILSTTCGK